MSSIQVQPLPASRQDSYDEKDVALDQKARLDEEEHEVPAAGALQPGTANAEAGQKVFAKQYKYKWILYSGLILATYIQSLDGNTTYQYLSYATSEVLEHSLSGTVQTAAAIIGSVIYPFMAKLCDVVGRGETYLVSIAMYIIGYCLIASAKTIGQIAGGTIFSSIASGGFGILFAVVFADITTLRWRPFLIAVVNFPYIINLFVSSEIVEGILAHSTWRWGYGMFIIMTPILLAPVAGSLLWASWTAKRRGLAAPSPIPNVLREPAAAAVQLGKHLDLVGLVLLSAALSLILLPLTLAADASRGWATPSMIVMIVIGCILLPVFALWEIKGAAFPMASLRFFKNKNIAASIAIGFLTNLSYSVIDTYLYSFNYVVQTTWDARILSYFSNTQTVGMAVFGIISGVICAYTRRFKYLLVVALCIRALGCGVMIHARGALGSDFELVATQILQAMGAGLAQIDLAAQASVVHGDVAAVIALVSMTSTIGSSVGSTIATAIWTSTMYQQLESHIPSVNSTVIDLLFADITVIRDYDLDSLVRLGALEAYASVMKTLVIVGFVTAIPPILIVIFFISNFHLGDTQNAVDGLGLGGEKVEEIREAAKVGTV